MLYSVLYFGSLSLTLWLCWSSEQLGICFDRLFWNFEDVCAMGRVKWAVSVFLKWKLSAFSFAIQCTSVLSGKLGCFFTSGMFLCKLSVWLSCCSRRGWSFVWKMLSRDRVVVMKQDLGCCFHFHSICKCVIRKLLCTLRDVSAIIVSLFLLVIKIICLEPAITCFVKNGLCVDTCWLIGFITVKNII